MKLVITTQIRENYAAHDGFSGEYYWKMKGGNTYVVENLNSKQVNKISDGGIPTLTKLIEEKNDYFEEYIIGWEIVDDADDTLWADWETLIPLSLGGVLWLADRIIENDEYGYMNKDVLRKRESWIPLEGSERGHFEALYQMRDTGEWITYQQYQEAA